jgi:hypothetical protein
MHNPKSNKLFIACYVIADSKQKKLFLTEGTIKNLHNLACDSTTTYFEYKNRYPNYEEVIIPDIKQIPLGRKIIIGRRDNNEPFII